MKHIKTLIFALLCALAGTAWADTETLGGYEFTIETDGEGSYYKVDCPAALDAIATYVNSNNSHTCSGNRFKQTADITYSYETAWNSDASYTSNYTPIGGYFNSRDRFFKGTYDGQGHTISGIRIYMSGNDQSDENQGLFGMTGDGAVIRGVTLADARITGYTATGGIVGYMYIGGTVSDCHVAANVAIRAHTKNAYDFGSIVGANYNGTISYCTSAATLIKDQESPYNFGGIVGFNGGTLNHNLAIGAIVPSTSDNSHSAICGDNRNTGTLENNYYYGCTVAGTANATGVGCNNADITENDGAVPGIILYDNSSNTDINSYILTTVGNAAVSRVELAGRTLYKDDKLNTLCLPFDVTVGSGQMEGATAMTLNASTSGFNASMGVLTLNFTSVTTGNTISAGTPFIVKWTGSNVTDPVFTGVTVSSTAAGTVKSSDNTVSFKGNYSPVELAAGGSNYYLGSGNKLYYPSDARTMNAFRAYFELTNPTPVKEFRLNFGNEDATRLNEELRMKNEEFATAQWYDLNGRKLSGKPTQRGIYIHEGSKVVVP